jgi:hypothetical protein
MTLAFRELAGRAALLADTSVWGVSVPTLVALLFFWGATAKSAQIPLYVWLPDAMAGPTPVSALIQRWVIAAYLVLGCFFAGWAMNWYLPVISPHWSEGYIIRAYYAHRTSPAQRLLVYKLNWKGENYYTGSRAIINETMDDEKLKKWVVENRGQRHYFLIGSGMEGSVERFLNTNLAEGHKVHNVVPPEHQSNKFTVVYADLK